MNKRSYDSIYITLKRYKYRPQNNKHNLNIFNEHHEFYIKTPIALFASYNQRTPPDQSTPHVDSLYKRPGPKKRRHLICPLESTRNLSAVQNQDCRQQLAASRRFFAGPKTVKSRRRPPPWSEAAR